MRYACGLFSRSRIRIFFIIMCACFGGFVCLIAASSGWEWSRACAGIYSHEQEWAVCGCVCVYVCVVAELEELACSPLWFRGHLALIDIWQGATTHTRTHSHICGRQTMSRSQRRLSELINVASETCTILDSIVLEGKSIQVCLSGVLPALTFFLAYKSHNLLKTRKISFGYNILFMK